MKYLFALIIAVLFMHYSAHAQAWVPVGTGSNALKANSNIYALCYDNGTLYAGGGFKDTSGYTYVAQWNGSNWQQLGIGDSALKGDAATSPICVDKKHNVYTCGRRNALNKSCVMKWNGSGWHELGTGSNALNPDGAIFAICTDGDGNVYAAGDFDDGSGNMYVAKWDGTSWRQLGTGSNALNADDDIMTLAADSHGNIYAGGWFRNAGYQYVAKWNGTTWHCLGADDDLGGIINVIYVDDFDNIYAAGSIWDAEARPYVAKWDGASWGKLGTGSNSLNGDPISAIQTITGDKLGNIYAAGGGIKQNDGRFCVKKWNGSNWAQLGTSSSSLNANSSIWSICTDTTGSLYAAGWFTDGPTPYNGYQYVAKFNNPATVKGLTTTNPIHAWPNPAHNVLYVQGDKNNEDYYICNMTGTVKQIMHSKAMESVQAIDISSLCPGIYFLRSKDYAPFFFNKI